VAELVAPIGGRALSVVREPVLVAVNTNEVLHVGSQANLLVRLEFREADYTVGVEHGSGDEVLVNPGGMMTNDFPALVFRSVELVAEIRDVCEGGPTAKIEANVTCRIAGKVSVTHDDPVDLDGSLLTKVVHLDPEANLRSIELHNLVEVGDATNLVEVSVVLRGVGNY
jgi:hypothetical protein